MPHLVDGDNLLGSWPGRSRSGDEKRALASEIGRFAAAARRRVVLVFDGDSPVPCPAGGEVLFAGGGRTADELILSVLRRASERAGWTVVTNDRSLADRSRHLGARAERCDVFRKLLTGRRPPEKPDGDDLAYWTRVFGGAEPSDGEPTR